MATTDEVRLLIPDLSAAPDQVFTDDQINTFISLGEDNAFLAAALALEVIATNEALTFRYVKTNDLTVDGARGAGVLLERAATLRLQSGAEVAEGFETVFPYTSTYVFPEATVRPVWAS